ncbi:MAG: hypothetical protein AUK55_14105 [Syntrophobacteraceae bacterium CG2_30_61_12]|nr:MAG: hypothetical protein AUK55_14105 [Syntrophobacteraceae bacterium CG2_30_61_12]
MHASFIPMLREYDDLGLRVCLLDPAREGGTRQVREHIGEDDQVGFQCQGLAYQIASVAGITQYFQAVLPGKHFPKPDPDDFGAIPQKNAYLAHAHSRIQFRPVKGKKFRFVCVLSRERGHLARF